MYKLPFFGHQQKDIVVLIDVGSASISGAYAHTQKGSNSKLYYSTRAPISLRKDISQVDAVAKALTKVTKNLLTIGAPRVAHLTGRRIHIDRVIISIAAPWQDVRIQTRQKSEKKSFHFTKSVMDEMVMKIFAQNAHGRVITNGIVVSIMLNGYAVTNPFGVKTKEAKVVVLGSYIVKEISKCITDIVTQAFHTDSVEITAFAPIMYSVLRSLYPDKKNMLVIDITGEATDVVLIKDGLLKDIVHTNSGLNILRKSARDAGIRSAEPSESFHAIENAILLDKEHNARFTARMQQIHALWLQDIAQILQTLNAQYVLPKTIFFLVDEEAVSFIKRQFNEEPIFKKIWLSLDPLSIISLGAKQFTPFVTYDKKTRGDPFLSILALYAQQQ